MSFIKIKNLEEQLLKIKSFLPEYVNEKYNVDISSGKKIHSNEKLEKNFISTKTKTRPGYCVPADLAPSNKKRPNNKTKPGKRKAQEIVGNSV